MFAERPETADLLPDGVFRTHNRKRQSQLAVETLETAVSGSDGIFGRHNHNDAGDAF